MASTIIHKRSSVASKVQLAGDLTPDELAVNTAAGKLFMKKDDNSVIEIGAGGGSGNAISGTGGSISVATTAGAVVNSTNLTLSDTALVASVTATTAGTTATTVDTFATATYRGAKYIVTVSNGSDYQISEALVIHDGTTAQLIEYGVLTTNASLGTLSATVNGSNIELKFTGAATGNSVKVQPTYIEV